MSRARRIDRDVLEVLSSATVSGQALTITRQLERNLYVRTNKVLEALGGKWNRGAKAHLFAGDAAELVDSVILTGEVELPNDFGFFPTPQAVVAALLERVRVHPGTLVLEPSAGTGAIATALRDRGAEVRCVELQQRNFEVLSAAGFDTACVDFLTIPPRDDFDVVVMNPPFAKRADVHHVMHAWHFLKLGGQLVSVVSAGVLFRDDRLGQAFREFVDDNDGTIEPLPENSFAASGTGVNTAVVTVSR